MEIKTKDDSFGKDEKNDDLTGRKKGFFFNMSKPKRVLFVIVVTIIVLILAAGILVAIVYNKGKISLRELDNAKFDKLALEEAKNVYYNGKEYVYNDDLINILLIGTDSRRTVTQRRESEKDFINAAMGDAFILLSIDTKNKEVGAITINRYSMTDIDMFISSDGSYMGSYKAQLSYQYGWGDELESSCELTTNTVSRMLYNIPINGYISLALPAIRNLNNAVGGVELVALDNIPRAGNYAYFDEEDYGIGDSMENVKGKTILLNDNQAYAYLRYRNVSEFGSADVRLERQKQYLKAVISIIKDKTKKDISFPLKVWDALSDYLVTDIDNYELFYLASTIMGYKVDMENIGKIPGTLQVGDYNVEEYYLDEDALKEMIISRFYKATE